MMNNPGLYVHIPFCKSKCKYCDFYSLCDLSKAERYVNALLLQFEAMQKEVNEFTFDSVYIGGGTPTVIGQKLLLRVIRGIQKSFHLSSDVEFTIEANPGTVDLESLEKYRNAGVNRISFGVQSSNDALLEYIGRIHSFDEAQDAIISARSAGFKNISVDLMYALPTQKKSDLFESVQAVAVLGVNHISMYGLKVEENTPFGRDRSLLLPDEDVQCAMYLESVDLLRKFGYHQYEISNFSQKGYESRHNLKYWQRAPYIGCGCAAHSFWKNRRFSAPSSISEFCECADFSLGSSFYSGDEVSYEEGLQEKVMLFLRTVEGIELSELKDICSTYGDCNKDTERYLDLLLKNGYGELNGTRFHFTPQGMLISNTVLSDLLSFDE